MVKWLKQNEENCDIFDINIEQVEENIKNVLIAMMRTALLNSKISKSKFLIPIRIISKRRRHLMTMITHKIRLMTMRYSTLNIPTKLIPRQIK